MLRNFLCFLIFPALQPVALFAQFPEYPPVKLAVFSDPHLYEPSLGTEGKAFQHYLQNDRKLLLESKEILETAVAAIGETEVSIVLVPGDLTKDGERINHEKMAEYLSSLESKGKKVFVIPGNHDINNPHSLRYSGDKTERVPSVSPEEFAEIYKDFGFSEAIKRDPGSLGYVAEPMEGLWILGLDACRYRENQEGGHPVTSGKFSKGSLVWIEEVLEEAIRKDKAVLVMMHHGALEHYAQQKKFYGEYVVDGFNKVSALFAEKGARIVFTGHFHAQDISLRKFKNGRYVMDIETGSLVTYPCPYRLVTIGKEQVLKIESEFITSIPSRKEFAGYARDYVHTGISGIAANTLIGMKVDSTESWALSGQVADAFLAHYKGDEITPAEPFNLDGISRKGRFLIGFKKNLVKSLHMDMEPGDNNLTFPINN